MENQPIVEKQQESGEKRKNDDSQESKKKQKAIPKPYGLNYVEPEMSMEELTRLRDSGRSVVWLANMDNIGFTDIRKENGGTLEMYTVRRAINAILYRQSVELRPVRMCVHQGMRSSEHTQMVRCCVCSQLNAVYCVRGQGLIHTISGLSTAGVMLISVKNTCPCVLDESHDASIVELRQVRIIDRRNTDMLQLDVCDKCVRVMKTEHIGASVWTEEYKRSVFTLAKVEPSVMMAVKRICGHVCMVVSRRVDCSRPCISGGPGVCMFTGRYAFTGYKRDITQLVEMEERKKERREIHKQPYMRMGTLANLCFLKLSTRDIHYVNCHYFLVGNAHNTKSKVVYDDDLEEVNDM